MSIRIEESWKKQLAAEFEKPYFKALTDFVKQAYLSKTVFPPPKDLFAAFEHTPFEKVKVVILGQDPYHGPGQAHGLAFSVKPGVPIPPSLQNIYKEIQEDVGTQIPDNGDLTRWADQGVLLLNSTLTVEAHQAGSHQKKGWEEFTDAVIQTLSDKKEGLVFLLWGSYAQKKGAIIDKDRHFVLEAPHPSPLSAHRGFLGCQHFSQTNRYLLSKVETPIIW